MLALRLATVADAAAIDDIYAPYVLTSTATWARELDPPEVRVASLATRSPAHPVIVAEQAGAIVGFGALSAFRDRWGYRHTVENSLYVRAGLHRTGIGRALLADLIARARALGHHTIIAGVSGDQPASLALHVAFGFREVARFREVGHKFDRWLDVVFLQRMLADAGV